jgi:hypothetical protein
LRVSALAFALLVLVSRPALAAPQWNTGVVPSGCLLGTGDDIFERVAFCGSARGDVLFLRENARDFGVGPYASVGTAAFEDFRASLGVSALLPVIEDFPLVLSAGPLLRDGRELGVAATAFWGLRSYNHYGTYNIAAGLVLSAERTFGERETTALTIGLHVDGFILAIPPLLLFGALK